MTGKYFTEGNVDNMIQFLRYSAGHFDPPPLPAPVRSKVKIKFRQLIFSVAELLWWPIRYEKNYQERKKKGRTC